MKKFIFSIFNRFVKKRNDKMYFNCDKYITVTPILKDNNKNKAKKVVIYLNNKWKERNK